MATLQSYNGKYYVRTKDNSGKWHNVYIGKTTASNTGKRAKVLTKAQANRIKQHYDTLEFNGENDFIVRNAKVSIQKALDECLQNDFLRGRLKPNLSTQTKNTYTEHVKYMKKWFKEIGIDSFKNLTMKHVDDFVRDAKTEKGKPMMQDTLRGMQRDLFRFLRWCDDQGYWNKARQLKRMMRVPKVVRKPKYLTMAELHELYQKVDSFYQNAVQFMYLTGCRRSDIGFMRFDDYNAEMGMITFTVNDGAKTKREIEIDVKSEVANIIEMQRAINPDSEWIFTNKYGNRLTGQVIGRHIHKGFKVMNKKATSHILRHTFASQMASHGANLKAIQELLRHARIDETMIYAHLTDKAKKEALSCLPV